jgi:hypothetical protein
VSFSDHRNDFFELNDPKPVSIAAALGVRNGVKTTQDEFLYDELQQALVWAIASEIRTGLVQARLPENFVTALTRHLTGRIAAVLDGRKPLNADGRSALPTASFLLSPTELLVADGPSWMSQHVAGTIEALQLENSGR